MHQTRRELLSKVTLAAAEHSMALHDAQEGIQKATAELELEKKDAANLRLELIKVSTFWSCQLASLTGPLGIVFIFFRDGLFSVHRVDGVLCRRISHADARGTEEVGVR